MFKPRRKADAQKKTAQKAAVVLALVALILFLVGAATTWMIPFYLALMLFFVAGLVLASGWGTSGIGAKEEETVAQQLEGLGKPYRVVHDVVLPGAGGKIDHIVLGPNGVFVIETENHNGFITCNGDYWRQRKVGRRSTPYAGKIGSPSKQVKGNAIRIRDLIREKLGMNLYVNGIVVFTNKDVVLETRNPTVTVVRLNELVQAIKTYNSRMSLNTKEIEGLEATIRPHSQFQ